MNHSVGPGRQVRCCVGIGILSLLTCSSAWSEEVSILASFRPDSANPEQNTFRNDTPSSGYCASYPLECHASETFSLRVPIQFNSNAPIEANHPSSRQGATFKVPAQWREFSVVHEATGEPETVKVRIAGLGSQYVTEDVVRLVGGVSDYRQAHNQL